MFRAFMSKVLPQLPRHCGIVVIGLVGLLGCASLTKADRLAAPADAARYTYMVVEVSGASMLPLVRPGENFRLLQGWYRDHAVERGDIVAYHYAGNRNPLMKVVYGVAGDRWGLREGSGWYHILVNGRIIKNSAGREYRIPSGVIKRLELYSRSYPVIPADACLILGQEPGGSLDSTVFGLASRQDLAGRLVRIGK